MRREQKPVRNSRNVVVESHFFPVRLGLIHVLINKARGFHVRRGPSYVREGCFCADGSSSLDPWQMDARRAVPRAIRRLSGGHLRRGAKYCHRLSHPYPNHIPHRSPLTVLAKRATIRSAIQRHRVVVTSKSPVVPPLGANVSSIGSKFVLTFARTAILPTGASHRVRMHGTGCSPALYGVPL